jgi:hypothetical protein
MIHEVKKGDRGPTDKYISYLLRDHTGARDPIQALNTNGIMISVGISPAPGQYAVVSITSQMTQLCLQGYVWREANPNDHVCVTPGERDQARQQNADGPSHRSPNGGPYGPDTCLQGYVWRDAFPNDHVCVSPGDRTQAAVENSRFLSYGPNTCTQGYVWREADEMDYVCVSGTVRDQTRQQNAEAASHRDPNGGPYGPDTCLQGYVWRDAFPGDHVCVTGSVRSQAQDDNSHAQERVVAPL